MFIHKIKDNDDENDYIRHHEGGGDDQKRNEDEGAYSTKSYVKIMNYAIPTTIACVVTKTRDLVNLIFLGHLGDKNMVAGVGLGINYIAMMGFIIISGLLMAMDTLIS